MKDCSKKLFLEHMEVELWGHKSKEIITKEE